ncbi:MAG: ABC transporter ATP-binding protein [Nocardioidaceae bacterium]
MGRNGSGKSSLLWALQGSRSRDTVERSSVDGQDPQSLSRRAARTLVGLVPADREPTCSTWRPSPRSAPRRRRGMGHRCGACRALLERAGARRG